MAGSDVQGLRQGTIHVLVGAVTHQGLDWGKDPLQPPSGLTRIHLLAAVGLRFLFLAGCWSEAALGSERPPSPLLCGPLQRQLPSSQPGRRVSLCIY